VVNPPGGRLWTANNRVVGEPYLSKLGLGTYDLGARAGQIRDGLRAKEKLSEADMLAIQLDDRAVFLGRWRQLLLGVLARADDPMRAALRREVTFWGGRAAVESIGYRVVRQFRRRVREIVLGALTAPCGIDARFHVGWMDPNVEESVWRLVVARPAHLLPSRYATWDELLQDGVRQVRREIWTNGDTFEEGLRAFTWGRYNVVRVRHPFSGLGLLRRWLDLDMPVVSLPGDEAHMPRMQGRTFGASQRLAVSPGREEEGYFHMPAGQSGHPRSPHYRDGHDAWVKGRATPFLPGEAEDVLVLRPR
jgi:penicillin amidase